MHGLVRPERPRRPSSYGSAGGRQACDRGKDPPGVHDLAVSDSAGARRSLSPRAPGLGVLMAGTLHGGALEPAG
eukprot:15455644-Alexandrium_andersonii.AAC.1